MRCGSVTGGIIESYCSYLTLRWPQHRDACCSPVAACSLSRPPGVMAVQPRKTSFRLVRPCSVSTAASLTCLHLLRSRYSSLGSAASALTAPSLTLPQPRRFNLHATQCIDMSQHTASDVCKLVQKLILQALGRGKAPSLTLHPPQRLLQSRYGFFACAHLGNTGLVGPAPDRDSS